MDSTNIHNLSNGKNEGLEKGNLKIFRKIPNKRRPKQHTQRSRDALHPEKLKGQTNIFLKKNDDMGGLVGEVKTWKFCSKASGKDVAEMIILDKLPFTTVWHEGFRKLMETTCPNIKIPSRFTVSSYVDEIYLEEKCIVHSMNLLVQDGLSCKGISVECIRNVIKYIRGFPKRLDLFKKCAKRANGDPKALVCLDCQTRWNSTHEMIDRAEKLEKDFEKYDLEDENYRTDLGSKGVMGSVDWFVAKWFAKSLDIYK
ncbi:hypothetical protein E3N88_17279 [Mikania micrantha]|uniref:Uncharacterized protein n=1 Tax=Mikania micrantha TaxID=192012 RepID=A0A5N6NT76_9ASTR|nr:hypothetical protein E3N88_17279 [Mikania micrantha]